MAAAVKCLLSLCLLCCLCLARSDLQLSEGSACSSDGVRGVCVPLHNCASAALSHIYRTAGYGPERVAPPPAVCSHGKDEPIVCCTDCASSTQRQLKNYVVEPAGAYIEHNGPKARQKCLEYFQRLPYLCRGRGDVRLTKTLNQQKQCHEHQLMVNSPNSNKSLTSSQMSLREAERSEFPHMALLGYGDEEKSAEWLSSGVIISERFILTVAHALIVRDGGEVKFAALGILSPTNRHELRTVHKIKTKIPHPEYKPRMKYHDIALLETETKIIFHQDILPACLDIGDTKQSYAAVVGWGHLGFEDALANNLRVTAFKEETTCETHYEPTRLLWDGYNDTTMMCYSTYDGKKVGPCAGDSGSPLETDEACLHTVLGLRSFGRRCGQGIPDVFTRVSHYVSWIESVVWP